MKKYIIIAAAAAVLLGALAFAGCTPEGGERTAYKISAVLDTENMSVTAEMDVRYVNGSEAELNELYFHLYPNAYREGARFAPVSASDMTEAYPHGKTYGGITVSEVTVAGEPCSWEIGGEDENILMISGIELMPGGALDVGVNFTLALPETRNRFGHYDGKINLGNWYPIAAVYEDGKWRADPYYSYGDPFYSEIADYSVTVTAPSGWEVAGTGSVTAAMNGDSMTYSFNAEGVRDFALCASDKYTCTEGSAGDVTVRFYGTAPQAESGLKTVCDAVETFSELFGEYPYDTLSVVVTPFLEGGMEYPSLVMISDELGADMTTEAIIHETAHQWWYAAVGSDQINEPWLDEGLTEFSAAYFFLQGGEPERYRDAVLAATAHYSRFAALPEEVGFSGKMSRPLSSYVSAGEYVAVTYSKGLLLFDTLFTLAGEKTFFAALADYCRTHAYDTATADDLAAAFLSQGFDASGVMNAFINDTALIR